MPAPRKPLKILQMNGSTHHNAKRYSTRKPEPVPTGPVGTPPEHLEHNQADIWDELVGLAPAGTLFNADRIALELAVRLVETMRSGTAMSASQQGQLLSTLSALGLTPQARTRLHATETIKETSSPWDKIKL